MNVLKRASAHSTAAFGLPILLSGAILVAPVRAADKMVRGAATRRVCWEDAHSHLK